jgi:4-amino-4-deoxy-L-arabinose transferase and related glycosyltransferases of PMT family
MRQHLPFLLILIGMAIARFVILFVSQTHLTSDEAIIGLMAKHILEGRYFPFYFYGTSYNASCAWEAYLAVIPFAIAGVGVVALKIPTVLLSLVCLTLFYMMTTRLCPVRVATLASLIFALWPGLMKWHFQPRGYALYFLFIPALIILFLIIAIPKPEPSSQDRSVFVVETNSPYRPEIETTLAQKGGVPPRITEHGTLTVIEQRFASESPR